MKRKRLQFIKELQNQHIDFSLLYTNLKQQKTHAFGVGWACREEEIRTLDGVTPIHTFQACSFNHSDTSLNKKFIYFFVF